jgi:hypothetical protein
VLALLPGSRTTPGTGAVRRSTPNAGDVVLETSVDSAGSAWSTLFDSRTKVNKAGDTMTGALTVGQTLAINGVAGSSRAALFQSSGLNRWGFYAGSDAESGGNLGSTFYLARYSDAGAFINTVVDFNRKNGTIKISAPEAGYLGATLEVLGNAEVANFDKLNTDRYVSLPLRMTVGAASGDFGAIGYNWIPQGSAWVYSSSDFASRIEFRNGGMKFQTAPQGANAGDSLTWADVADISQAGNFRLRSAAPKIEHETGGQVVGEIAFGSASGRGTYKIVTRDTAGANIRTVLDIASSTVLLQAPDQTAFFFAGGNNCELASGGATVLWTGAGWFPVTDNARTCGDSGFRWSAVWAANGTIQTSDLTDKTDIARIDPDLASRFVQGLRPILYRWQIGGQKSEQVPDGFEEHEIEVQQPYIEEVDQPITETVDVDDIEVQIEIRNGVAVRTNVPIKRKETRPVGIWLDMVDEHGTPITQLTGTTTRIVGRGKARREIEEPVMQPVRHFVPSMRRVKVERVRIVKGLERVPKFKTVTHQVPGKRMHAGFGAQDIKVLMDRLKIDCGLWVLGEDGKQSVRPDQLIPFLAAALGSALSRIDALELKK